MAESYDLVVVGASFAGLVCAKVAAERGLAVAVMERKRDPGDQVHTTGILVKEAAEAWPVPESLTREVAGVRLYAPSLAHVDLDSPGYAFHATDTPALLRWMAAEARAAGARLYLGTPFRGASREGGRIVLEGAGISARYLVGADGARSAVAEHFGLGVNRRFLVGLEAEYEGVAGLEPGRLHCFLDSDIAPGYLAWAVPGVGVTQVGLACRRADKPELERLVAKLAGVFDFTGARVVARRSGPIPVGGAVAPAAAPGVALVGDAAGLVSPLTAGGIYNAIVFGRLAGVLAAEHLLRGGPEPGPALVRAYPRYRWKGALRRALDLGPPNWLLDLALGTAPMRAFARLVYFHTKGLGSRAAWRELLRGGK